MKDARRASNTFDAIAEHFDKTRNRPWKEVIEFLEDCKGTLLDIGCGNGRHLVEAMERGLDVYGIDASMKLLHISKRKVKGEVELLRADAKYLPFEDKSFENIIYIATIHHLKQGRVQSLKESKRILDDGGRILVSSWARELDRWDLEREERNVVVPWHREDGEVIERFYHLYRLGE
ncbi:MAG: class I SAM-dependent methyltransferase, partial [Candidatus Thermoplasmatota archaeon]|nr:class I SAM-dependent methyltransferase [Candidatus Thermoplasmatota archaeon]